MLTSSIFYEKVVSFIKWTAGFFALLFFVVCWAIFVQARDMSSRLPFDIPVLGAVLEKMEPSWVAAGLNDRSTHSLDDYDWVSNDDPVILWNRHMDDAPVAHQVYLRSSSPIMFSVEGRRIKRMNTMSKQTSDSDMSEYSVSDDMYRYSVTILEGYKILKESPDGEHFLVMLPDDMTIGSSTVLYVTRGEMLNIIRAFSYYQESFKNARTRRDRFAAQDKARIEQDIKSMK